MVEVHINEAAVYALINDPDGPVGELLAELAGKATMYAKGAAPVMQPQNRSWSARKSTSYGPPGRTKGSVRPHGPTLDSQGRLYSGVNAVYGPTLFLEKPADQLHYPRHFLSDSLYLIDI